MLQWSTAVITCFKQETIILTSVFEDEPTAQDKEKMSFRAWGPSEARCSSSIQKWVILKWMLVYMFLSWRFFVQKQQWCKATAAIPSNSAVISIIMSLGNPNTNKVTFRATYKHYKWSSIWSMRLFFRGGHPACSPLYVCASPREAAANRRWECWECRYMNASITHAGQTF